MFRPPELKKQAGATLVVSLVILAVITVLGIASIRSSNLELKMAASARDKSVAKEMAESAIEAVGTIIRNSNYTAANFLDNCALAECFTQNCDQTGLCFSGTFTTSSPNAGDAPSALHQTDCKLNGGPLVNTQEKWKDKAYWTGNNVPTVDVVVYQKDVREVRPVNYMIEFLCFAPKDENIVDQPDSGVPLYRITTRADGPAGRSTVMLQSVFVAGQ